jgi:hypothetical protein
LKSPKIAKISLVNPYKIAKSEKFSKINFVPIFCPIDATFGQILAQLEHF